MKRFSKLLKKYTSLLIVFSMMLSIISSCQVRVFAEEEFFNSDISHKVTLPMEELIVPEQSKSDLSSMDKTEQFSIEKDKIISDENIEQIYVDNENIDNKKEKQEVITEIIAQENVNKSEKFDVQAAYEKFISLEKEEEQKAYLDSLTIEEYSELENYVNKKLSEIPVVIPKTIVFTEVGPFLPPVFINSNWKTPLMKNLNPDNNGIETSKTVQNNGDGTYTLKLESYVTGDIKTVTKTTPVDIVLVLDQSGSMSFDFNGNETNMNNERRQFAMKEAVNAFINEVAKTYRPESDHRISIVTFGNDGYTLSGWQYVDENGKINLKQKINDLPSKPAGSTNIGAGMQTAENLMGAGYNYTGNNNERQKVVIAFTDGAPTKTNKFDVQVANSAILSSKNLKDNGVTIYSVGIFGGANPDQLYGDKGFKQNSNGSVGSIWYDRINWMIGDDSLVDIPACNRFLNYVSSNLDDADEIGLKNYKKNNFYYEYLGWEITKNFDKNKTGYYLTADNSESLKNIFEKISSNIGGASIELGKETILKDIISNSFKLPEGAGVNSIKVFTCDYNSNGKWNSPVELAQAKIAISNLNGQDIIDVSGFDYSKNFCSEIGRQENNPGQSGNFYGRKIQVLIPIEPISNFIGGNDIATNTNNSGIYDKDNTVIENFISPKLNIPIKVYTPKAFDINVFYGDDFSLLEILNSYGDKSHFDYELDGIKCDIDGKNNEFVDITYKISTVKEDGTNIVVASITIPHGKKDVVFNYIDETTIKNIKKDFNYKIDIIVSPVTNGEGSIGEKNDLSGLITESEIGNVKVFKPIVQFNDVYAYLGNDVPTNEQIGEAYVPEKTIWTHGDILNTNVQMYGNEPKLDFEYEININGKINKLDDIGVTVTTKSNNIIVKRENNKFNIKVFYPEMTFKDSEIKLGESANYNDNYVGVKWKFENNVIDNPDINNSSIIDGSGFFTDKKIIGKAPKLIYDYNPGQSAFNEDTPVKITSVKILGIDITEFVKFIRQQCSICEKENGVVDGNKPNFIVHIKCIDLKITKQVSDVSTLDPNQTFIFEIKGKEGSATSNIYATVSIKGNETIKIKKLPVGEYTIKENQNWSWKYNAVQPEQIINTENEQEVVFKNIFSNNKWLDANAYSNNIFIGTCDK